MVTINVDFASLQRSANTGVIRIALFLGLGVNSANNPALTEYQLSSETPLQFLPSTVDKKTLDDYKNQFSRWIVGCAFRGLIETFSVFLDEVYRICLLASSSKTPINPKDYKKFRNSGPEKKLSLLSNAFHVGIPNPEYLITIQQARNCLTHRLGNVGIEDCGNSDKLIVKWEGFDLYAEENDGKITPLIPMPKEGVIIKGGGQIKINQRERTRIFPIGSLVSFSPADLAEICLYVINSIAVIVNLTQKYAIDLGGVPIEDISQVKPKDS